MAKRRSNSAGSITKKQDKNGNTLYYARVSLLNGKRPGKYFKKERDAQAWLNENLNNVQKGTFVVSDKIKLSEWLDTWMKEYKLQSVRPTTYASYTEIIELYLKPMLGYYELQQLRPEHVQKMINDLKHSIKKKSQDKINKLKVKERTEEVIKEIAELESQKISPRTVKYTHIILNSALSQALKNNLIVRNPCDATVLPKQQKKEMRVLSLSEQEMFMDALQGDRLGTAFMLDLATGLRRGELLALRWQDIDLKEGTLTVNQSLSRVKIYELEKTRHLIIKIFDDSSDTKTKLIIQAPKTKAGKRKIPLMDSIVTELKKHRKAQLAEKEKAFGIYENNGLVFCNEVGKPIDPRTFTKLFHRLIAKSEIDKANLHALRHSFATRLLEVNEHPKVVQEMLGHSSITLTLDTYSHVMPEIKKAAVNKLSSLFEKITPSINEG